MFIHAVISLVAIIWLPGSDGNMLLIPPNSFCACPGEVLTYICTAEGTGNTIWRGSLFDCPNNEIALRHSLFASNSAIGSCNNGAVVGRSVGVESNHFTSELLVTVRSEFNNKTVICIHDSAMGLIMIGTSTININEAAYPPPDGIHLARVDNGTLIFEWNPINSACAVVQYDVLSNCGSCHGNNNLTNVSCSNLRLSTNLSSCSFALRSSVCGNIFGNPSDPIMITLRVPDVPQLEIIPIYNKDGSLIKLAAMILEMETFSLSGNISGAITGYNIHFIGQSTYLSLSSCEGSDRCEREADILSSSCPPMTSISIVVTASNILGIGPPSDPVTTECTNGFVVVNIAASTISCMFLNDIKATNQSCSIMYWLCDQGGMRNIQNYDLSNDTQLILTTSGYYCYIITAMNGVHTIRVEGNFDVDIDGSGYLILIIVPVVVIIFIVIVAGIIIIAVTVVYSKRVRQENIHTTYELMEESQPSSRTAIFSTEALNLKKIDPDRFIVRCEVDENCQLKQFLKNLGLAYAKGCAFYELISNEIISEDKEMIFMKEETKEYFHSDVEPSVLREVYGLYGEMVTSQSLSGFKIFVQSKGSGTRHLPKNSHLLYEFPQPAYIDHSVLKIEKMMTEGTIEDFCTITDRNVEKYSIYIEFEGSDIEFDTKLDVIFMNKDSKKCFTSPFAGQVIHVGISIETHWKVFKVMNTKESLQLKEGTLTLWREHVQGEMIPLEDSENFKLATMSRVCTLRECHKKYNAHVYLNVTNLAKLKDSTPILDAVLVKDSYLKSDSKHYTIPSSRNHVRYLKGVQKPWKAFVLCLHREDMELNPETEIIYRAMQKNPYSTIGEVPLCSKQFLIQKVSKNEDRTTLKQFFKGRKLKVNENYSAMIQHTYFRKAEEMRDVFIWNKTTRRLITGPSVRGELAQLYQQSGTPVDEVETVFVSSKAVKEGFQLKKGTSILIPNPELYVDEKYFVFVVDKSESKMRLSEFINERLASNYQFEKKDVHFKRGRAFYEFTEEEDLRFYRDVVYLTKAQEIEGSLQKLESGVHLFYSISGIHMGNVKPPSTPKGKRIFIQSTSQGSMCVEEGMTILYKVSIDETTVNQHKGPHMKV